MWLATIHRDLSKNQRKQYLANDLKNTVLKIEPDFIVKLQFAKALCEAAELGVPFIVPDLDDLNEIYGRLGAYLHAIKSPLETFESREWWEELLQLLDRSKTTLGPLVSVPFMWPQMNEHGKLAFQEFRQGSVTYEELVVLLKTTPPTQTGEEISQTN